MSHAWPRIFRHVLQVISAVRGEKAARHLQHVFLGHQPLVRGECRMDAEHRRESRVILARHAGVGGHHQASDRGRGERDRLRHLSLRQLEERAGRDRAAEDRGDRAVEAALAAPRGERFVDAPRDLVAVHHCREHVAAVRGGLLRHGDRARRDNRADVRDAAQVAVVRSGGVAHHRVDPRRVRDGQSASAVEPKGGLLRASVLLGKLADDSRGNDVHAHRRAGDRAGDHHSCAIQRERRQVGDVRARQKPRQLSRDAQRVYSSAFSSARCRLRRVGRS